jgi:uncharacterized membrane protein YwzB
MVVGSRRKKKLKTCSPPKFIKISHSTSDQVLLIMLFQLVAMMPNNFLQTLLATAQS